jgi:hypothetical protein
MTVNGLCNGSGECVEQNYCDIYSCWKIPPTSQIACYDDSAPMTCSAFPCQPDGSPDFCGQDAQYPDNPRTFTETTLAGDVIVTDSLTGLVWQKEYLTGYTWLGALDYCSGSGYAGQTDWRLPDIHEVASLVNYGRYDPSSDFPGMPSVYFWSADTNVNDTSRAWYVNFYSGQVNNDWKTDTYYTRCVRGAPYSENIEARYHVSGTTGQETVLDRATGLVWQRWYATGKTWKEALRYCEERDYGGYNDWRLPNVNELRSLANVDRYNPTSDFPGMPPSVFWTSSSYVDGGGT